jgi:hypothetical protein
MGEGHFRKDSFLGPLLHNCGWIGLVGWLLFSIVFLAMFYLYGRGSERPRRSIATWIPGTAALLVLIGVTGALWPPALLSQARSKRRYINSGKFVSSMNEARQAPGNPAATGSPRSVHRYGCTPGWRSRREALGANGVLRSSVTSTEVTRVSRATCVGPTHRLLRLVRLNAYHPRPVNAHATTKRGGCGPRAPAACPPGSGGMVFSWRWEPIDVSGMTAPGCSAVRPYQRPGRPIQDTKSARMSSQSCGSKA